MIKNCLKSGRQEFRKINQAGIDVVPWGKKEKGLLPALVLIKQKGEGDESKSEGGVVKRRLWLPEEDSRQTDQATGGNLTLVVILLSELNKKPEDKEPVDMVIREQPPWDSGPVNKMKSGPRRAQLLSSDRSL